MRKLFHLLVAIFFQFNLVAQTHNAEVVNYNTDIEVGNGRLVTSKSYEIRINNRSGERYTKITIPYSQILKVSEINAFITDVSGRIVKKLKKKDIVERSSISSFSLYEDDYVKEFSLKHNTYPYTIHYSFKYTENQFIAIEYWNVATYRDIPTNSARLKIKTPLGYTIKYVNSFVEEPITDTIANEVTYTWISEYKNILEEEACAPDRHEFFPMVKVVPEKFTYEIIGSFESWQTYGAWQHELMSDLDQLPENEIKRILEITENIPDTLEKIRALYHYLQDETRYINVSIETGGLKPYPATYVAKNKFGDCKALSNYFKAALSVIGVKSYYCKVYSGNSIRKVDTTFPAPQFNHIILYLSMSGDDIWLDCTSDGAFNYLGESTQNRNTLVVNGDSSYLKKTPKLSLDDVLESRKVTITYDPVNTKVKFKNAYRGPMYEELFYLNRLYNEKDKLKALRNYFHYDGFELVDYQVNEFYRDSVYIELICNTTSQEIYKHYGNDIVIGNIPFDLPDLEKPDKRKMPLQLDYPVYSLDTIIYDYPKNYQLIKDSIQYNLEGKYGVYSFIGFKESNKLIVIKKLLLNTGFYPLTEYKKFYSFIENIKTFEKKSHLSLTNK